MIVTTTPAVEGRKIVAYKGIVFGEVVSGVNFIQGYVFQHYGYDRRTQRDL